MTALQENSLAFVMLRTIPGMTPPEWAYLASTAINAKIDQGFARTFDGNCRTRIDYLANLRNGTTKDRLDALMQVAVHVIVQRASSGAENMVRRLAKADISEGLLSLQHVTPEHIPYAILLYEGFPGRRSHTMASAFWHEGSCFVLVYAVIRHVHVHELIISAVAPMQPETESVYNHWQTTVNGWQLVLMERVTDQRASVE
jgi:hypothetical protein